jgi:hypothetical protein
MNTQKILQALKDHANEEIRIHKEVFASTDKTIQLLAKKHIKDTKVIHQEFWKELKKAWKSK